MRRTLSCLVLLLAGCETSEVAQATVEFRSMESQCIDPCPGGDFYGSSYLRLTVTAGDEPLRSSVRWLHFSRRDEVLAEEAVALEPGESTSVSFSLQTGCPTVSDEPRDVTVVIELDGEEFELDGEESVTMGYDC